MGIREVDMRKEYVIALGCVLSIGFAVWFGFSKELAVLDKCEAVYSRYVTAHYERTYATSCMNSEGNLTTCVQTDYWSNPASDKYTVTTFNGTIINEKGVPTDGMVKGVYRPQSQTTTHQWLAMRTSEGLDSMMIKIYTFI